MKVANVVVLVCLLLCECRSRETAKQKAVTGSIENNVSSQERKPFVVGLPDGFAGRGTETEYTVYSDSVEKHNGHNASTIKSLKPVSFATIISNIRPKKCIGQRIRYTAWVRSKDVKGWAGLWLRIDPKDPYNNPSLGFDNMSNRPITGTSDWKMYEIVLDVPEGADDLVYGALLDGDGQIWVDSMEIKIVNKKTPPTDEDRRRLPKVL